ncbi:MAG: hypothetical protein CMM07_28495 [Rhodopirellula sp.]|nr:hypothetical protein [Rhodopirellula sp.]
MGKLLRLSVSACNANSSLPKRPSVSTGSSPKLRSNATIVARIPAATATALILFLIYGASPTAVSSQEPPADAATIGDAEKLAETLGDADLNKRRNAAYQLATMGPDALPAIDALIAKLDDRDEQVWMQAVTAIGKIGPEAGKAIEPLCKLFSDRSVQKRYRAAWAVGQLGPEAIPMLRERVSDSSTSQCVGAIEALGWMTDSAKPASELLAPLLKDDRVTIRRMAVNSLGKLGPEGQASLALALLDDDSQVKTNAVRALGRGKTLAAPLLDSITQLTKDKDPAVRAAALIALGRGMHDEGRLLPLLLRGIQDPSPNVQGSAAHLLQDLEGQTEVVRSALSEMLKNDQRTTRIAAARALGALGQNAAASTDALITALRLKRNDQTEDDDTRLTEQDAIVKALTLIGAPAVPALLNASNISDSASDQIAVALAGIASQATAPLVDALQAESERTRAGAANALAAMTPVPETALKPLIQCLADPSVVVRTAAINALSSVNGNSKEWLARLETLAVDPTPAIRQAAVSALDRAVETETSLKLFTNCLSDPDETVRLAAAVALGRSETRATSALKPLLNLRKDQNAGVRKAVIEAIGKTNNRNGDIVATITELLSDPEPSVRIAAIKSIGDMELMSASIVSALKKSLDSTEENVLLTALPSLGTLGAKAEISADQLAKVLQDQRGSVRSAALKCIAKVESDREKMISVFIKALEDSDWTVRGVAANELGEIGTDAKRAVPKLFQMLASQDDTDAARGALRGIDSAGPEAVPILIEGLKSTDRRRQFYAIFLLGKVGAEASTALPVLKQLRDDSESVRAKDAFTRAIKQIEAEMEPEPTE